MQCVLKEHSSL